MGSFEGGGGGSVTMPECKKKNFFNSISCINSNQVALLEEFLQNFSEKNNNFALITRLVDKPT